MSNDFKKLLEKLIYLQRLIPMIIPIYYHPFELALAKDGYFDNMNMLQFIKGSHDKMNIEL
jgi:hypothetical protein